MVKDFKYLLENLISKFASTTKQPDRDSIFVNSVIKMIRTEPEKWKARWFDDDVRICKSIRCGNILVMYDTGNIIHPVSPAMTRPQRRLLSRLAQQIVKGNSLGCSSGAMHAS